MLCARVCVFVRAGGQSRAVNPLLGAGYSSASARGISRMILLFPERPVVLCATRSETNACTYKILHSSTDC